MHDPFDLDDILEEIKKKKSSEKQAAHPDYELAQKLGAPEISPPDPAERPAQEWTPKPPKDDGFSSLDGLADYFGKDARAWDDTASEKKKTKGLLARKKKDSGEIEAGEELAKESSEQAFSENLLNLEQWQEPESDEAAALPLDKTQLSIPLSKTRTAQQELPGEFGETQQIQAQKPKGTEGFDFASLQNSLKQQEWDEQDTEERDPEEEIDDFSSPADIPHIKHDLSAMGRSLSIKLAVVFLLFAGSFFLSLAQVLALPLPALFSYETSPKVFLIVQLSFVAVAALVCNTTVGGGLAAFFTLKSDVDSLCALAVLSTIIQGVALVVFPERLEDEKIGLFFVAALFALLCNLWGKKLIVKRIDSNFKILSSDRKKEAVLLLKNKELARELSRGMDLVPPNLAYSCKSDFHAHFLEESYETDNSEGLFRIIAPIIVIGSLIVSGVAFYLSKDILLTLSAFSAVLCISAPVTSVLCANLPIYKAQKTLAKEGAVFTGFGTVDEFSAANGVLVDVSDLFPSENVVLHNIKMFEQQRIDEAILDASSALCSFEGTIKSVFMKIIQGKMEMLRPVENLVYEEGMGLSAWVDGKRILIGNSALMRHHEVYTPSQDYESKYRADGRELIYLSNSGELTAMFVISYRPDPQIANALYQMERKGIALIVKSNDPNLSAEKIAEIYEIPVEMVQVISAKLHSEYELLKVRKDTVRAGIAFLPKVSSLMRSVAAAVGVKSAINLAAVLQTVGIVLGYGLMSVFVLLGSMQHVNGFAVLAYQALWGAGTLLFSNLRRY